MSAGRIEEIRARLDAATPGPWRVAEDDAEVMCIDQPNGNGRNFFHGESPQEADDAEFIAHAPADIAFLLGRVEALTDALVAMETLAPDLSSPGFRRAREAARRVLGEAS